MSAPEDPAAKAYRILTETDPLWDLISPAGTAAGLLATPSPAERLLSSLAPPPPDLFERGVGALEREAERRSENMDGMREELTEIKTKLEALAASKAEPEATPLPAKPGQITEPLPGHGPIKRRKRLIRILDALEVVDPYRTPIDMPGTSIDLFWLCQAVDAPPKQFMNLRTFQNCIKDWLKFPEGRGHHPGETAFYRDSLAIVRRKLA